MTLEWQPQHGEFIRMASSGLLSSFLILFRCRKLNMVANKTLQSRRLKLGVMRSELPSLPRDKFDTEAASAIARAGWPQIEPIILQLLAWLQDANWPVARTLTPTLVSIGSPLEPFVRHVLGTGDETWKFHLIEQLIAKSSGLRVCLKPDLERIARNPNATERAEHVDRVAREVLGRP